MQIIVINVMGSSFPLDVSSGDYVEDVKDQIQVKMGIDPKLQRLSFCGAVLVNTRTLGQYQVQSGSNIHFSMRTCSSSISDSADMIDQAVFSSPEIDWEDFAKAEKAKVDKVIDRKKVQYDIIQAVKLKTIEQLNALKRDIEVDVDCEKDINKSVTEQDEEKSCLMQDISSLQEAIRRKYLLIVDKERELFSLRVRKEELLKRISVKKSRHDMLLCDIANLDQNMKRIIINKEEFVANHKEELKKDDTEKDCAMKDFLNESISAKKAMLECPVCYETASPPIHRCPREHLICSQCLPRMNHKCPSCRSTIYQNSYSVFRFAEEIWKELQNLIQRFENL